MATKISKSRQKSCDACAIAKRQCDRTAPACSRCTAKSLSCEYKLPPKSAPPHNIPEISTHPVTLPNDDFLGGVMAPIPALDTVFTELPTEVALSMAVSGVENVNPNNFIVDDTFFSAYDNHMLSQGRPRPCEIGVMDRSRIRFLVRQLKTYPALLVHRRKTPFIHPQAYHPLMSPSLQDAVLASALYLSKNADNEEMVWEIVSSKVAELLQPRATWTVSEHLACLQAFIIYQIIRLFDGDIRQRADAEQNEDMLMDWTDRLVVRTDANAPSAQDLIPTSWQSWVFEEVVSRTIIVARMVQAMFEIQKRGYCTMVEAVGEMSFTASRALYGAPTAMHFLKAIKERARLYVKRMDFGELEHRAVLADVDELGVLMLVCYKGVDGANEWIMRKGNGTLLE